MGEFWGQGTCPLAPTLDLLFLTLAVAGGLLVLLYTSKVV